MTFAENLRRSKIEVTTLLLGIALLTLTFRSISHEEPKIFIPPPPIIRHFHFGYRETMADLFWIRVVQDFSVCEQQVAGALTSSNSVVTCNKGWVFKMLDLITDLAPRFKMPFYYGATNLSVLVNDPIGAKIIFDKGVKNMPDSWDILYRAGYHYMIELKDKETAANLLVRAGKNGAPAWVYSLAGRLYTEEGKADLAKSVLNDILMADPDGPGSDRIKTRLKMIEEELAKSRKAESEKI